MDNDGKERPVDLTYEQELAELRKMREANSQYFDNKPRLWSVMDFAISAVEYMRDHYKG